MSELSFVAQVVMDAYLNAPLHVDSQMANRLGIAAALRAVADQVVPKTKWPRNALEYELGSWNACDNVRNKLLAIATELEGQ